MTRHRQFYLTLPSNSSMNYYPNNTVANYTTHLPASIHLTDGEWEIALVEAHYPCSFMTVGNDAMIFVYVEKQSSDTTDNSVLETSVIPIKVEPGNYKDIDELLISINTNRKVQLYDIEFQNDTTTGKVELTSISDSVVQIELSPTLSLQLGYDVNNVELIKQRIASRPPNLLAGIPSHMYVYCDLVEPQLVGDTVAPLMKIVNIDTTDYKYGAHKLVHFNDPHYVPVLKSLFESVEIDLRSNTGQQLPFHFGTTCMKLHLRSQHQR